MNVLHLVEYLNLGGIERLLEQMAVNTVSERAKLSFFSYETTTLSGIGKSMAELGIPVTIYKKKSGYDLNLVKTLIQFIKDNKIDVIHTHDFGPMEYAVALKCRFPHLRFIHTQHTLVHFLSKNKYKIFFQFASFFYTRLIVVSQFVKETLELECQFMNKKIVQVIPNGVDTRKFIPQEFVKNNQNLGLQKLKLVSVARISPVKNMEYLLQTCVLLKNAGVPFEFHHAGTGKDAQSQKEVDDFIVKYNLQDEVILHGYCDDASQILSRGDIFVSASKSEGHPVAVLEAMSCGKYCLVSDIAPHKEMAHDLLNFFDISLQNDLFDKLQNIYLNKIDLSLSSKKSRQVVQDNYSLTKMVDNYVEQYRN
jgi:glycosyltransferase involved in cell wall biosynthesis